MGWAHTLATIRQNTHSGVRKSISQPGSSILKRYSKGIKTGAAFKVSR